MGERKMSCRQSMYSPASLEYQNAVRNRLLSSSLASFALDDLNSSTGTESSGRSMSVSFSGKTEIRNIPGRHTAEYQLARMAADAEAFEIDAELNGLGQFRSNSEAQISHASTTKPKHTRMFRFLAKR
mmetsp:Transcript_9226/g.16615  ORF Transcript_9226/g.16615 Transcript_9226/m.16615 type:complete len:128 (-) Transcript_9226:86-469(-)|eukprot:CAMPEP_0182446072 /NCGR_PEP_ID=MMETSP1172-20130603/3969_1 /TAXON_ID=708627 /ORGANISM="Timspurckia oligopyrenoides, Strain CCMP3278" /LENGTH=127 /DNA_ID=CAMNT_0024641945 /DNA_START=452 /DNA_END=835 /DNA_ORIENTATION=+